MWNCRGAGHRDFLSAFKHYKIQFKPDVAIIVEPRLSGLAAEDVVKKLGFDSHLIEDARGFAGGIWLMWNSNQVLVREVGRSEQAIHVTIDSEGLPTLMLSAIYACPRPTGRALLWDELREWRRRVDIPGCLIGDFNSILSPEDKAGGSSYDPYRSASFRSCVEDCELLDLGFVGPRFTWYRGSLRQRLDRALDYGLGLTFS
ncbi:hypothetical protein LINPERHAP2_LOCUS6266 [Linum perenne]